jgi:hypothetical protein
VADVFEGLREVGDVGIAGLRERRGDADVDHVAAGELAEVGARPQSAFVVEARDLAGGYVLDVGDALLDELDLAGIEVEASHAEAGAGELHRQRQPHVAEADHADAGLARVDPGPELLKPVHVPLPLLGASAWSPRKYSAK